MFTRKAMQKEIARETIALGFLFELKSRRDIFYIKGLCTMAKDLELISAEDYKRYMEEAENQVYCAEQARSIMKEARAKERAEKAQAAKSEE